MLVKFKAGTSAAQIDQDIKAHGGQKGRLFAQIGWQEILVPQAALDATVTAFSRLPDVARAAATVSFKKAGAPNDPGYAQQWALPRIAWDQAYGSVAISGSATIAVLDTGVDAGHPDLAGVMAAGQSEVGGDPNSDPNGHGTALAGIAAAEVNNATGMAGVAYAGARIASVQVLAADGTGSDADIVAGVLWAANNGAKVILMGFSSSGYSAALADALAQAWSSGAVLVAATGNDGSTGPTYPAGIPNVIGVAATDQNDALAASSNTGSAAVAAPGAGIYATQPGGGYGSISGTSAASAEAAGLAALLIAGGKSNADAANQIRGATDPVTGQSFGRINVVKALGAPAPAPSATPTVAPTPTPGATPTYVIASFKAALQGQSSGSTTWTDKQLTGWKELQSIPVRVDFTGGPITGQSVTVNFDHNSGTTPGIQNLTGFTKSSNVTISSGPTLITDPGGVWSYTFTVNVADSNEGWVQFSATMAAGAHNFTGSSLSMGGSPALGQLQIAKPGAAPGSPDLAVTKTGQSQTSPGATITYNLGYQNKATGTNSGTGVGLTDNLPTGLTFVTGSCLPTTITCSIAGNTITWNLGTLAPGATGSLSFQATVPSSATNGTTYTNSAQILSAENDANTTDNSSSLVTTVTANVAPVAANDSYSTNEDTTLTVPASGVLGNDTDANGDTLTAAQVSGPSHGTLTLNSNGGFTYVPASNFNGTDTFTYKANDGKADSNIATVTITVNAVNDAPVATNDSYATDEDTPLAVAAAQGVLANDTDVDSTSLTTAQVAGPSHGTLTLNANGSFTYTPDANYSGSDSFTYRANDGSLDSNAATVSITVNAINNAPVAANDSYSTNEDTPLTVAAPGVLGNDTDVDSSTLTAVQVAGPAHGTLSLGSDGSFTYTPAANYNGSDSFTYKANDGSLDSAEATVTITVNAVNDAPVAVDDAVTTAEDTEVTTPDVRANDTDADGDQLYALLASTPAHGSLRQNAAGIWIYTPEANFNGTDSFNYRLVDSLEQNAASDIGTVTITVTPVNDAPVAESQAVTTDEDTAANVTLSASDTETAASGLVYTVGQAAHGTLSGSAPNLTYTPNANYNGPDSFTFTVTDTGDGSAPAQTSAAATVTITVNAVNDAPVAVDDAVTTAEDTEVTTPDVRANDTDADGDQLYALLASTPAHGSLRQNAAGIWIYTPEANFNGTDSFNYRLVDSLEQNAASDIGTVTITVTPVSDPPVAVNDAVSGDEDTTISGNLLTNDTDVDSALLTVAVVSGPAHGSLALNPNGSFGYSPNANFNGPDSFTYKANDGALDSNVATVTITVNPVNDPPTAVDDSFSTDEDTPLTIAAPGLLGNDSDIDGTTPTAVLVSGPNHGTLTLNPDGSFGYTPNANYNGPDGFTYKATDGSLDSTVATVAIAVKAVNDAPAAANDSFSTDEDTPLTLTAPGVLSNDSDVENDVLAAAVVGGPTHGSLALNADGSFSYTPNANYNGLDSFTYKANDGAIDSNTATVSITVNAINDAPAAASDSYSTDEDAPLTTGKPGVLSNDSDVENDALTAAVVSGPSHGSLALNADGSFTYTPGANYNGSDSFTYKANDGSLDSNLATVSITVNAVNDKPAADSQSVSTNEDAAKAITLTGSDTETRAADLVFNVTQAPAHGTLTGARANLTYTPNANYNGSDSFKFTVTDTGDGSSPAVASAEATVSITVNAVNDTPTANSQSVSTDEDNAKAITLTGSDTETAAADLTFTVTSGPAHGTLSGTGASLTYTPAANYNGPDSFKFTVTDTGDGSSPALTSDAATVEITVSAVNDAPVATNDSASGDEDTTISGNVLSNDTDIDSTTLTAAVASQPAHGAVTLNADGSFIYTPAANYNGSDSFTYKANDGSLDSNEVTVSITVNAVNDKPTAASQAVSTNEDTAQAITLTGSDTETSAANLTFTVTSGPAHGTLSGTGSSLTYTPNANYNGADSFKFTVTDTGDGSSAALTSDEATVTITVNAVNDKPTADSQSVSTNEDTAKPITLTGSDTETSAANLTFAVTQAPAHGTLSGTGVNLSYMPAANYNGPDSFSFTVTDTGDGSAGALTSDPAAVNITVSAVNDKPTANSQSVLTNEDTAKGITLTGTDVETSAANLTFTVTQGPTRGTLSGTGANLTYTPAANYNGPDSFKFTVTDTGDGSSPALTSDEATVSITINPVNDAPTLTVNASSLNVQYSDPISAVNITAEDIDSTLAATSLTASYKVGGGAAQSGLPGGLSVTFGSCATNTAGTSQCTWSLAGTANVAPGIYTITLTVSDGALTSTQVVTVTVTQEDARTNYTGALFASTASATSGSAIVTLSATVQDITAVTGDPAFDAYAGDITKATVTFVNRDSGNATLCTATVGLVNPQDSKTGTATCNWSASINGDSQQFTVGTVVGGYYIRNASTDNSVVTVSKPLTSNFITGGGYITLNSSGGQKAGDAGSKNNFGFNVKYNKGGTNLQGNINAIVRRTEPADGKVHVYQVKGNSMTSLSVQPSPCVNATATAKCTATFNGKASIQDITDPNAPVSVDGNATLQVTMTDYGQPGSSDTIGITVWNKSGGLWYSSNWNGTKTSEQTLTGGNLVVH